MPGPHISGAFGDLLDPRFQKIFHGQYNQHPDWISMLYSNPGDNGRADMRWSQVGALGDWSSFTGTVGYQSSAQGYDTTATHVEFASGIQIERKLFNDDQYNVMDTRPRALADSAARTRQKHAARLFNNAFSTDTMFYTNQEGLALCSASHTTTASGVSTATGFNNLTTAALSAVSLSASRIQMRTFRGDVGERIDIEPNELWIPPDLFEVAYEIVESMGKVDTANNNPNVHKGRYTIHEWVYMTDTNNWFMCDGNVRKQWVFWIDRIPIEFAMAEDLDTLVAKWRGYMRYSMAWTDWRFILGGSVS